MCIYGPLWLLGPPRPGNQSVIIFFVLSGLVIPHAAARPDLEAAEFALRRATRVWSVVLPALMLSALLSLIVSGQGLTDSAVAASGICNGVERVAINLLSLGQIWHVGHRWPLDAPFWSLSLEVCSTRCSARRGS